MSDKAQGVFDLLKETFGSREVAAGILGNIDVETGGSFDYGQKQYKGGPGRGLLQMEGQMLRAYNNYLGKNMMDDSAESQIKFLKSALDSDSDYDIGAGHRRKLQEAFKSGDIDRISEEFSNRFLRPGKPHLERRKKAAQYWNDLLVAIFGNSEAYAGELEFDLSRAVPVDEEGYNFSDFDLSRAVPVKEEKTDVPQLRALPADYEMRPPTKEEEQQDFNFAVNRMAEQIFEATTGLTPEEGELGKKKFEKTISLASSAAIMGPLYALGFEAYRQAKSAIVSAVKEEDYSPIEQRVLTELLPEDMNKWARRGVYVTEIIGDIALMAGAASLAKQGALKDAVKTVGQKLQKAGYGEGQVTIPKAAFQQAAKGTSLEKSAKVWIQSKLWKPVQKAPEVSKIGATAPATPVVPQIGVPSTPPSVNVPPQNAEQSVITQSDIPETPEPAKASDAFLQQPKKKTTILSYLTPAEYHLKELGFDTEIGKPVREALQDFSIELMKKNENLINIQKEHYAQIPKENVKASNEKIWQLMDKGIKEGDTSVEAGVAQKMREGTKEMLSRINEVNRAIGKEEVREVKEYILHMLRPEILNEIYARGVIPPELAKVMEHIPPKNVFLRTAMERKGVPEEWLVKDPYELMRAMYAIDLRYIHLQKALAKIDPYLKAVKDYVGPQGDYWPPETYKYLDNWIKQAIKMRPSEFDTLTNNLLEATIAPILRKTGLRISHMPWRDLVNFLSASVHTGALGMRVKPILRNFVQSTFDWVMYGTNAYLKGSSSFMTKEGHAILKQSKVWQTRAPFEAQDLSTLQKVFKVGSIGYRASDLHNVGKGILTRYYHAVDDLKMSHDEAIKWTDDDLPSTQWSYRREDLPRAYWTTTGRAFWTLGSWWMNFYTRFLPELLRRSFTGKDVNGRIVSSAERLGILRFLGLVGLLYAVREGSKELTGTAVDYTGQVRPTPLREAPVIKLLLSMKDIGQGLVDEDERTLQTGLRELSNTSKIFIPWYLATKDLIDLLSGEKEPEEILFYIKKEPKSKKVRRNITQR